MIFCLLGEVHSCHPSIIPVSTLVFLGRVWPWQPKLSSSSHHHPRLKGPSARKTSSRHHPKVQKMIIQPSSKTQGALSKKKKKTLVVIIFVRLPVPAKWDDGEMSPIIHPKSGWWKSIIHVIFGGWMIFGNHPLHHDEACFKTFCFTWRGPAPDPQTVGLQPPRLIDLYSKSYMNRGGWRPSIQWYL